MQTSTHGLTIGEREVRKEFVAGHEAEAQREWDCLTLLAEHVPGLAPRPLRREDGETPVIVMERLPGQHLDPRPHEHVAVLVEWLADDHDLAGCVDSGLVGEALALARQYVAAPGLPEPRLTALGIADLNPANVLWDGPVCRLVDFEDGGLPSPVRGVLASDAASRQRRLAPEPARHHRGPGRAFHGSRGPRLDWRVGAGPLAGGARSFLTLLDIRHSDEGGPRAWQAPTTSRTAWSSGSRASSGPSSSSST